MKKSTIALIAAFFIFIIFQIVIVFHLTGRISDGMHAAIERQNDIEKAGNVPQEIYDSIATADSIPLE